MADAMQDALARRARREAIAKAERAHGPYIVNFCVSRSEARLVLDALDRADFGKRDNARMEKIAARIREGMAKQMASDMARIDAEFPEVDAAERGR